MRDLAATSILVAWCSFIAASVGRRTLRANWRKMHRLHLAVLERTQRIETRIVADQVNRGHRCGGRHAAPPAPTVQIPVQVGVRPEVSWDALVGACVTPSPIPRPPRRARVPRPRPVIAGVRVTTRRAATGTAAVMAVAAATLAVR